MQVEIQSSVTGAPATARVKKVLSRAAKAVRSKPSQVSVLFCADTRMRGLNRRYRGKDQPTDVLAFPAGTGGGFLGDIVISVPYASREAKRRDEPPTREIDRLLLHGFLHLMGYDHETDEGQMEALEGRIRRRLGIAEAGATASRARPRRSAR